jgi:hypothetical protein
MYTTDYGGPMTNADDTLALLAAANPVPELPAAEPPERLRRLIEAEGHTVGSARRRTPAGRLMRPLAAVGAAMLAATVGLLLSNGASSPGLNIAAAAYAATSSGSGVLEARFVDRTSLSRGWFADISHHREWIDASTGMRRVQRTLPWLVIGRHPGRQPDAVFELASSPGWLETWDSTAGKLSAIHRIRYPAVVRTPVGAPYPAPRGAAQEPAGIATYRRLYRERSLRLIGRERRDGRLLWKFEGDVAFAFHSFHAKPVPIMAVVVLVDPRTYLPVVQRTINLLPGHRRQVQSESELLGYRRLPSDAASEALLKLSAQHPHAQVVTENPTTSAPPRSHSHYIREPLP